MKFIPKVILLGNEKDLPNNFKIDYEIIGKLDIKKDDKSVEFFYNGQPISIEDFQKLPYDYVLCTDYIFAFNNEEWLSKIIEFGRLASTNFFREYVTDIGFTCDQLIWHLVNLLTLENVDSILDFDSFFYRCQYFDYPRNFFDDGSGLQSNKNFQLDSIITENFEPIFWNLYDHIYKSTNDIKLKTYDLIIFTAERSTDEWLEIINWAIESTDKIILYIHEDSAAYNELLDLHIESVKILQILSFRGILLKIESQYPKICRVYVVYHKPHYIPKLPEGYIKIHAGKKNSTVDLQMQGDDTGDNISELNPYLNELTVTYWAWKNTKSDYIGFSHYSRFFVIPDFKISHDDPNYIQLGRFNEHILTTDEAIELLKNCDIIVRNVSQFYTSYMCDRKTIDPNSVKMLAYKIFCKYLSQLYPDYLTTLEKMESGNFLLGNSIFFTRWKVFDEYCKWLFSFIIPAVEEFLEYKHLFNDVQDSRAIGYLGEEAFQIFVMHNHLRIKYVRVLWNGYESTAENFDPKNFT